MKDEDFIDKIWVANTMTPFFVFKQRKTVLVESLSSTEWPVEGQEVSIINLLLLEEGRELVPYCQ